MAVNPLAPGVYIDEISVFPPSVVPVATAVPVFIGYTEKAEKNGNPTALVNIPTRISNILDYERIFGRPFTEVIEFTVATSTVKFVSLDSAGSGGDSPSYYRLYYSLLMYFNNGGGPCYVISIGNYTIVPDYGSFATPLLPASIDLTDFTDPNVGIEAAEKADEITLLLSPEATFLDAADHKAVNDKMLQQCGKLKDRFTIIDPKSVTGDVNQDAIDFRDDAVGANNLKYGGVYYPLLVSSIFFSYFDKTVQIMDGTFAGETLDVVKAGNLTLDPDLTLYNTITALLENQHVIMNPGSSMAGIYATVDRERGVWKAPANVSLSSVIDLTVNVSAEEQGDSLNIDATSGKSINAIRKFTGKGLLVWGSRTLAGNDNEWRYIPVRRLFIMAEESIQKASEFVVFEPNDKNTWTRVKTLISSFLTNLWRDGALAGATPEEAFFVKVGLGETMSAQDILEGKLIIQVGMAAVRPAEFIILQFSHKLQES